MEYMEGQMQREIERGMMEDDPKATIYIQFSDTGTIRKWSCEPFEGGVQYVREAGAEIARLRAALEAAAIWHEDQDKAISKQPSANTGDNGWRRMEHQEQRDNLRAALENRT